MSLSHCYRNLCSSLFLLFIFTFSILLTMKTSHLSSIAVLASTVLAQNASTTASASVPEYTIQADNITAIFIPYGATLVSLLVPDRNGTEQDVVVGYDNGSDYPARVAAGNHTYFGAVVGRYANRIKNGTFTIDGQTSHIPTNENDGLDTLHGGDVGYDQRNWTVVASNDSSVSFQLIDTAFEGFPGTVLTTATYSVSSYASGPQGQLRPRLTTQLVSVALDEPTPIMLSNHIYWNLAAFQAEDLLNNTYIWMPYSDRYIQTDGILIPNGTFGLTSENPGLDFQSPKLFGTAIDESAGKDYCGTGCDGIDNAFAVDRPASVGQTSVVPVLYMWSETTGIQMTHSNNQIGLQIYSCVSQDGSLPAKQAQIERNKGIEGATDTINQYGCIVVEPQAYIDGINNPQWGVNNFEVYSPQTGPAINYATYDFSTV